jgi:hypothetical protein
VGGFHWLASGAVASANWILDKNTKIHPENWMSQRKTL